MNDQQKIELYEWIEKKLQEMLGSPYYGDAKAHIFVVALSDRIQEFEQTPPAPPPKRKICEDILTPGPAAKAAFERENEHEIQMKQAFKDFTTETKEFLKSRVEPNMNEFIEGRVTPNCTICQWKKLEEIKKNLFSMPITPENICTAQGDRYIKSVYGNKICKRLFSELPTNKSVESE